MPDPTPTTAAADPAPAAGDRVGPVWTVVVAGGGGTRFGGGPHPGGESSAESVARAKQYVSIAGRRVLDWSVAAAAAVSDGVVVVLPAADLAGRGLAGRGLAGRDQAGQDLPGRDLPGSADDGDLAPHADRVVAGGATRSASVRAGLDAVPDDAAVILVHDAARPAASVGLFVAVVAAVASGADGVVPAVAVTDSLRHRDGGAVDRTGLVAVQTPQGFDAAILRRAHATGAEATDDATLVEQAGGTIVVVDGETTNTKLTHPGDRAVLEQVLADRARTGGRA